MPTPRATCPSSPSHAPPLHRCHRRNLLYHPCTLMSIPRAKGCTPRVPTRAQMTRIIGTLENPSRDAYKYRSRWRPASPSKLPLIYPSSLLLLAHNTMCRWSPSPCRRAQAAKPPSPHRGHLALLIAPPSQLRRATFAPSQCTTKPPWLCPHIAVLLHCNPDSTTMPSTIAFASLYSPSRAPL